EHRELERVGWKSQVAGDESQAGLAGGVGDDEDPSILPLVQAFGDLIGMDEPQHGDADNRERDVPQRPSNEVGLVLGFGGETARQADKDSPAKTHATASHGRDRFSGSTSERNKFIRCLYLINAVFPGFFLHLG